MKIKVHMSRLIYKTQEINILKNTYKTFLYNSFLIRILVKVCPECGGGLSLDPITKNFICRSCGLYAPREKFDELHEKLNRSFDKNEKRDEYLEWWQSSKKDKKTNF